MKTINQFLLDIKKDGLQIKTIYDIGACKGQWSKEISQDIPSSNFYLFEANPAYEENLKRTGKPYYCGIALSNPGRESVEFFNGTDTGDSYYKETTVHYDKTGSITLPCTTLDEIIDRDGIELPDFIKIDTQGSELDILSGAHKALSHASLVYTECPIICYNKGAPNINDYLEFFKKQGFIPVDILEIHKFENIIVQIDIMFMRNDSKEKYLGKNVFIRPFA